MLMLLVGASCGSDTTPARPVAGLSASESTTLCQEFFTAACAADAASARQPSCSGCDPCAQAASLDTIRSKCGDGITDADVRHCISSRFDMPTCTGPERGGCMFDVGDALCP